MSKIKRVLLGVLLAFGLGCMGMQLGCQPLTPEAQKAYNDLETQATELAKQVPLAYAEYQKLKVEFDAIMAQVNAGVPLTQAMTNRLVTLTPLLTQASARVEKLYTNINGIIEKQAEVKANGGKWWNRIPWGTLGGIALGIVGTYVPVVRPLQGAVQAAIQGVSAYSAAPKADNATVKDFILEASRANGSEVTLDKLVQQFDPPAKVA